MCCYISFPILLLIDGTIVGITIGIIFLPVLLVVILFIMVILIFKGQHYLVMNYYINTVHVCVLLECSTKQNRRDTWMLEHCTTNNSNSDTVVTANEGSTTIVTSQIQSTAVIVLSLNFQDRQPDPLPYTELNVPVQLMASNYETLRNRHK